MPPRKARTPKPPVRLLPSPVDGQPRRGPGRPPIHQEAWTKATVVLFNRQIAFLDQLAASVRAHNGTSVSRAQLIRAIVDAVAEADIDLTAIRSEAEMKAILLATFR